MTSNFFLKVKVENLNKTFHASKSRTSNFVNLLIKSNIAIPALLRLLTQSKLHKITYIKYFCLLTPQSNVNINIEPSLPKEYKNPKFN